MSTQRTSVVNHADWCPASQPDSSGTACVAIREEPRGDGLMADGGPKSVAVCQVCGVESRVRS